MASSTLTSKGQLTLPKEVRNHLHLREGDRVDFVIDETGRVTVSRAGSRGRLSGFLHDPARPSVGIEDMDRGIAEEARRRSRR